VLPLYVGALALGGALIAVSAFAGAHADGGDADADADAHLDAAGDALHTGLDKDAAAWLPFLSLRFWTFGLGAFGLTGLLLHLLSFSPLVSGVAAGGMGVFVGLLSAWAFRRLRSASVSGNVRLADLAGQEAEVLLPVGPGQAGKVRLLVDGQLTDLIATTRDTEGLPRRSRALVVAIDEGRAIVTALPSLPAPGPGPASSP
jgi:membrane protein implicated in regulation of membrane protease activity